MLTMTLTATKMDFIVAYLGGEVMLEKQGSKWNIKRS